MRLEFENRVFKIWKYDISHSKLLIRSPKNKNISTNFDIIFYNVKMIFLPKIFRGNSISSISSTEDEDIKSICELENLKTDEVYVFRGDKLKYFIIASIISVNENENDIFDVEF